MTCPACDSKVEARDVAKHQCPTCGRKIYFHDRLRWLRGLACVLLAVLTISYSFPREADLGKFLLWICLLVFVFYLFFILSFFLIPPEVDLLPPHGPIRLDI